MDTTTLRFSTNPDKLLNTKELAEYLHLSVSSLSKKRVFGDGPPYQKIGRSVLYRRRNVDEWLAKQTRCSTSDPGPDVEVARG